MPPQLLYFGGVGAVLAAIWLAQHGPLAQAAADKAAAGGPGSPKSSGGGGMTPVPVDAPVTSSDASGKEGAVYGSYQYNYGEQASADTSSAYGGTTDNSSSSDAPPHPAGYIPAAADYQAAHIDPDTGVYTGGYIHSAGQYESTGQVQPEGPSVYTNEPAAPALTPVGADTIRTGSGGRVMAV